MAAVITLSGVTLALPVGAHIAIAAQIVLALLVVVAGIHITRLLHDEVPSSVRAAVASAVSTMSWLAFIPLAIAIGLVSTSRGVPGAGWLFAMTALLSGTLLILLSRHAGDRPANSRCRS